MFDLSSLRFFLILNWLGWTVSSILWIIADNEKWFSRAALAAVCLCGFAIFEAVTKNKGGEKCQNQQ